MRVVDIIINSMQDLGGRASLSELYKRVNTYRDISEQSIRARIYTHSSDSKYYKQKDPDLFRKIDTGIWALRSKENSDINSSISWLDEIFISQNFVAGELYKKVEIRELSNLSKSRNVREQWGGIVRLANAVLIFVNLDKSDAEKHLKFNDYFEESDFFWESRNNDTIETSYISEILEGIPVYLFCRISTKSDFIFVGQIDAIDFDNSVSPLQFQFEVLEYKEDPNEALSSIYNWRPDNQTSIPKIALKEKPKRSSYQGYARDQKRKKFIEDFAMIKARDYYESLGFDVRDCSNLRNIGYDYLCKKGSKIIEVEVKGTGMSGEKVNLTKNEVNNARQSVNQCDLYVVHCLDIMPEGDSFKTLSYEETCLDSWSPKEEDLEALSFSFRTGI